MTLTLSPALTPAEFHRFTSKICPREDRHGCRLWTGGLNSSGYGYLHVAGQRWLVHRLAHVLWIGTIPEGLTVDHVYDRGCRSKLCVEPSHLEAVTRSENSRRGQRARGASLRVQVPLPPGWSLGELFAEWINAKAA